MNENHELHDSLEQDGMYHHIICSFIRINKYDLTSLINAAKSV